MKDLVSPDSMLFITSSCKNLAEISLRITQSVLSCVFFLKNKNESI